VTKNPATRKPAKPEQKTLSLDPVARGRFEKSEPTIVGGEDLDVPTFLRQKIKLR
jgi:cell division protein FtsZ